MNLQQTISEPADYHHCIGHKEGDWVIFTCLQCRDYERRINWKTGEMTTRSGGSDFLHKGYSAPVTPQPDMLTEN